MNSRGSGNNFYIQNLNVFSNGFGKDSIVEEYGDKRSSRSIGRPEHKAISSAPRRPERDPESIFGNPSGGRSSSREQSFGSRRGVGVEEESVGTFRLKGRIEGSRVDWYAVRDYLHHPPSLKPICNQHAAHEAIEMNGEKVYPCSFVFMREGTKGWSGR